MIRFNNDSICRLVLLERFVKKDNLQGNGQASYSSSGGISHIFT